MAVFRIERTRDYTVMSNHHLRNEKLSQMCIRDRVRIGDSFKKMIVVKDNIKLWRNEEGIVVMGIMDFLLDPNSLDL